MKTDPRLHPPDRMSLPTKRGASRGLGVTLPASLFALDPASTEIDRAGCAALPIHPSCPLPSCPAYLSPACEGRSSLFVKRKGTPLLSAHAAPHLSVISLLSCQSPQP